MYSRGYRVYQNISRTLGIGSKITRNNTGQSNLITKGTASRLLFCGHVDVVPALDEGWTYPPFSGTISDGFVWGRGATDMKGGCASMLAACQDLVDQDKDVTATWRLSAMKRRG